MRRIRWTLGVVSLLAAFSAYGARAESYPSKLIKIIVPFSAGATTDALARLASERMQKDWNVSVIVEDRPGASGMVGAQYVAKAPPDGYMLILVTDSQVSLPNMFKSVPFDPVKDFTPIIMMGRAPNVFVVNPATPVHSIAELIALAQAHPGQLSYGSAGPGGSNHMTAELFKLQAKVNIVHVPYKGGAPNALAVVANEVPMSVSLLPTIDPFLKSKQVRPLAITSAKRMDVLPDVPTMAESGFPGFESYEWWALLGPAGMPKDVVDKLNVELAKIMASPDVKQRLRTIGVEYSGDTTPQQSEAYMKAEMKKWAEVAKGAGMKPE